MYDLRFARKGDCNMGDTIQWSEYNRALVDQGILDPQEPICGFVLR
ncbi:MAG: hypothetical protein ACO3A2_09905 [Bdellovibrionia bacterium]